MSDKRRLYEVPSELSPEYNEYVDDAVALAKNQLSPERAAEMRDRMASDPIYRAVIEPIVEAYKQPALEGEEAKRKFAEFLERAGIEPANQHTDLDDYRARVTERTQRNWRLLAKIAAVFAFLFLAPTTVWMFLERTRFETISTRAHVTSIVQLPDQSSVQLAPGSSVRYLKAMGEKRTRSVKLNGEGTFVVRPSAYVSFVVETDLADITVKGTRFRVQAYDNVTLVAVEEGRVSVQPLDQNSRSKGLPVTVGPGGQVRITTAGIVTELGPSSFPSSPSGARP